MHSPGCLCCECLNCDVVPDGDYIDIAPAYLDSDDDIESDAQEDAGSDMDIADPADADDDSTFGTCQNSVV